MVNTQALAIIKEAQILRVFDLVTNGGLSITAACGKVGINPRTYRRWVGKDSSLARLREELAKQNQAIVAQLLSSRAAAIAELSKMAATGVEEIPSKDDNGNDIIVRRPLYARDRLAIFQELERLLDEIMEGAPAGEGDDAAYLNSQPKWLMGPQTRTITTVETPEGVRVTVQGGEQPMIEAEARVIETTPADAPPD